MKKLSIDETFIKKEKEPEEEPKNKPKKSIQGGLKCLRVKNNEQTTNR